MKVAPILSNVEGLFIIQFILETKAKQIINSLCATAPSFLFTMKEQINHLSRHLPWDNVPIYQPQI